MPSQRLDQTTFFSKIKSFPKVTKSPPQQQPTKNALADSSIIKLDLTLDQADGSDAINEFENKLKKLKEKITAEQTVFTKGEKPKSIQNQNKGRWVRKPTAETEFTTNVYVFSSSLSEKPVLIHTSKLYSIDDDLRDIFSMVKMYQFDMPEMLGFDQLCSSVDLVVISLNGVPLFQTTQFKSLLEDSVDRILNFYVYPDELWKEYLKSSQEKSVEKDRTEEKQVHLLCEETFSTDSQSNVEYLNITVKSLDGRSHVFQNLLPSMSIHHFYEHLEKADIYNKDFKLHFDSDVLLPSLENTFISLGIENGDSFDYF